MHIQAGNGYWEVFQGDEMIGCGGYCADTDCRCQGIWTTWGEGVSALQLKEALAR